MITLCARYPLALDAMAEPESMPNSRAVFNPRTTFAFRVVCVSPSREVSKTSTRLQEASSNAPPIHTDALIPFPFI